MSKEGIVKTFEMPDGTPVTIETGKLAKQADGSVVVKVGNTMLLATVVATKKPREGVDFLPLSVDYQEKYASVGRFPGGFFKREARLSEYEILICRLVDRALRPLFPSDYHADIQVMISLISADKNILPDALAGFAASAALAVSDIPFGGPISEVRVARIDGQFVINPTAEKLEKADFDAIVAATEDNVMMVEGEMKECSEEDLVEAIKVAHEAVKVQVRAQKELAQQVGGTEPKREYDHEEEDLELKEAVKKATYDKCYEVVSRRITSKEERKEAFDAIKEEYLATMSEEEALEKGGLVSKYFSDAKKAAIRDYVLNDKVRLDGRQLNEIRPIWTEVDYLPAAHGSAVFTRGETQSLTTVTLGTKLDEQIIDGAVIEGKSDFLLHYNFPAFSTGEVRPNRGPGRREIGHGNLALRALKNQLPEGEENPYTVRVVSDILESNGSSSMATVCAGSMALMDAGLKLRKAVSGIAMGLIMNEEGKYAVLSDILGDEDHIGDMDFKVTGTKDGITACQMDIKVDGLPYNILLEALEQARDGRLHILNEMDKTISEPRHDYKSHAPRIVQMTIPKDMIGAVIGPGGKIIQEIQNETGAEIAIEEVGNQGIIDIASENKESVDAAIARIKAITAVPEVGETYKGKVKNIMPFGAFIEIMPGKDGLLHISEITWERLEKVEDVLSEGDEVEVKLIDLDQKSGKMKLSRKVLLPKPERNN